MKYLYASERGRLIRERQKYIDDYNARKTAHDTQVQNFKTASENYSSDMENYIRTFLSAELDAIPGVKLAVKLSDKNYYSKERDYYVKLWYASNKQNNTQYFDSDSNHNVNSGQLKGISWTYTIFIRTRATSNYNYDTHQYDYTFEKVLEKAPQINANILQSDDLDMLKRTYDLFDKMETIDWQAILDKINNSEPKESDFITTEHPGRLDTSEYDAVITDYNIARIIGKDIWIKVNINREDSYDRYSDYSTNPGVDGKGWIKVYSATPKFYTFNWIGGDDTSFSAGTVNKALRRTIRMKKIYIEPITPCIYQSTEDLTDPVEPSINDPEPQP